MNDDAISERVLDELRNDRANYRAFTLDGTGIQVRIYYDRVELSRWYAPNEQKLSERMTLTLGQLDEIARRAGKAA